MSDAWVTKCSLCHGRLINPAQIDDTWYCHRDGDDPSCYQLAVWADQERQAVPRIPGHLASLNEALERLGEAVRRLEETP